MDKILYKYTTLESLALILRSKKIRLNPLTVMDDLQEAQSSDEIEYGKYVFISSWMDQPLESIAMWKLYSNMYSGVRIGLKENPFVKYTVNKQDVERVYPSASLKGDSMDLIVPIEECFNGNYFVMNFLYDMCLEKVEYTDNVELLSPQIFNISQQGIEMKSAQLGKYKNTYWEFQNEERYVLRFLPLDVKKITSESNAAQMVYDAFMNKKSFIDYYDLEIRDDAFVSMEITLSPQFTMGNRILLEALIDKYNPNLKVHDSVLKDRVKLQIFRDCKMLAKSPETIKNVQNIKNNYTKYSNVKHDQTQYIVAEIEFE